MVKQQDSTLFTFECCLASGGEPIGRKLSQLGGSKKLLNLSLLRLLDLSGCLRFSYWEGNMS
ncbi:hypothetical protein [Domibacillus indicus]|uniref:hypothetical protein n=1 Tax=Domibacillus indicus TaxID=1437523 RepID=UPI000617F1D6|nr:hypothetical protein [Domibacillus indicus]